MLIISGPLITVTWAPTSFAMALAIIVFPVPGGPYKSTPLGGEIPLKEQMHKKKRRKLGVKTAALNNLHWHSSLSQLLPVTP